MAIKPKKRLQKSNGDRLLFGVAGGLADYLDVERASRFRAGRADSQSAGRLGWLGHNSNIDKVACYGSKLKDDIAASLRNTTNQGALTA